MAKKQQETNKSYAETRQDQHLGKMQYNQYWTIDYVKSHSTQHSICFLQKSSRFLFCICCVKKSVLLLLNQTNFLTYIYTHTPYRLRMLHIRKKKCVNENGIVRFHLNYLKPKLIDWIENGRSFWFLYENAYM